MNFRIFALIWSSCLLKTSKCSKVIDSGDQKGIYISDYCPNMQYCAEGAHVMCMFYNPQSRMGPRCSHPRNVSITRDLATKLLEVTNAIRSKIALGKERGKGGVILPRAYGMFKLKWDNELATFAQVLANQCVLRHDLCRASKKFPDPGQTAGLVRFSYPDWFPVSHNAQFTKPGLTISKLDYATTQSLKSWYSQKDHVTSDMIYSYPDWERHPDKLGGRLYLEMIHGSSTHMGCGMSAYAEYAYHDNKAGLNYNSVQIICNFSSRPRKESAVYTTASPTEVGYTVRCGCPAGTEEDVDCLCSDSPNKDVAVAPKLCEGNNCKPAVVLLPIFTMEDAALPSAPSRKSAHSNFVSFAELGTNNATIKDYKSNEDIFRAFEVHENDLEKEIPDANFYQPQSFNAMDSVAQVLQSRTQPQAQPRRRLNERIQSKIENIRNRYFDRISTTERYSNPESQPQIYSDGFSRKNVNPKESVFSRVDKFELPRRADDALNYHDIRKDVAPRKDFTQAQRLLDTYLVKKRHHEEISPQAFIKESDNGKNVLIPTYNAIPAQKISTTGTPSTGITGNVINFNRYLKNKFHYEDFNVTKEPIKRFDIKNSNEESDKKLMNLLDTLEQEVKHIELDVNEKEIFDAKIRKIYGTVVGKPPDLLNPKVRSAANNEHTRGDNYIKISGEVEDLGKRVTDNSYYETEDRVKQAHSKLYDKYSNPNSLRQYRRNPNSLEEEKNDKEFRQCLRIKGRKEPCLKTKKVYTLLRDDEKKNKYNTLESDDFKFRSGTDLKNDKSAEEIVSARRNDPYSDAVRSVNGLDLRDLKNRRVYRNEFERSTSYYDDMVTKGRNTRRNEEIYDDPLTSDRRKFYQEKLDKLERKMHNTRSNRRRNEFEREQLSPRRYIRPTTNDVTPLKFRSKSQMNSLYIPDRARFLHGF